MTTQISGTTGVSQIQDNTVTSAKVQDGTLAFADLLATDWTNSKAANGYTKLPNGIYIQWGQTASAGASGTAVTTFPIAFPTLCASVVFAEETNTAVAASHSVVQSISTTQFTFFNASAGATTARWIAIGY